MTNQKHDWDSIAERLKRENYVASSIKELARHLKIPYGTVYSAVDRGDLPDFVEYTTGQGIPKSNGQQVKLERAGNEAALKYQAAEPLTEDEVMAVAGLDPDEWVITSSNVNLWQMGRKHKVVDLEWVNGKADGFVRDDGELKKTYLYQIELKLTRRDRVAVKPVIQSINVQLPRNYQHPSWRERVPGDEGRALFIADPHFGYRLRRGRLVPIHSRHFINALMAIAVEEEPSIVVWNGDLMDLADWSRFDTEPELLNHTQVAALEASWVLARFRALTGRQVVLEGNHDVRAQKEIIKHLGAAYDLRPVHELEGAPLLSLPRLLSLDTIGTEWIDGYPHNSLDLPGIRFIHGDTVRKGSGRTASAIVKEVTISRFFGHVHRHELVRRSLPDVDREVWVGSPGCACDRRQAPGSGPTHNWQLGAFLIHYDGQGVTHVEHVAGRVDGPTRFRGRRYEVGDYLDDLVDDIPDEYGRLL